MYYLLLVRLFKFPYTSLTLCEPHELILFVHDGVWKVGYLQCQGPLQRVHEGTSSSSCKFLCRLIEVEQVVNREGGMMWGSAE